MRRIRILVVTEDDNYGRLIGGRFRALAYDVAVDNTGWGALLRAQSDLFDLVLLDIGLGAVDGLEFCQRVRDQSEVPIIFLSQKGSQNTKVEALNRGADDFLVKPSDFNELLASTRAILRRTGRYTLDTGMGYLAKGAFELDPGTRQLTFFGRQVRLTRTEFDLLHCLMRNADKVVSHKLLLTHIWGPDYRDQTEYLRVYVGRLRRKIEGDPAKPCYLLTDPGFGYVFRAQSLRPVSFSPYTQGGLAVGGV